MGSFLSPLLILHNLASGQGLRCRCCVKKMLCRMKRVKTYSLFLCNSSKEPPTLPLFWQGHSMFYVLYGFFCTLATILLQSIRFYCWCLFFFLNYKQFAVCYFFYISGKPFRILLFCEGTWGRRESFLSCYSSTYENVLQLPPHINTPHPPFTHIHTLPKLVFGIF